MPVTLQPKWFLLFIMLISFPAVATAQDGYWPEGKTFCVTLTYDDGLPSHLEHALPQLKAAAFKGTFFWLGEEVHRWSQDDLDQVREAGHELAGHTIFHPCPRKFDWVKAGNASEDYNDERMAKELDKNLANQINNGVEQGTATFAYPCGCTYIDEDKHSYVPLVKERFFAARSTRNGIEVPGNGNIDLFDVKTIAGDQHDLAFQLAQVDAAKEANGWLVFMFHGVGGDHLAISADDHREILRALQEDDSVWVATFQEAAAWVKSKQENANAKQDNAEPGTPDSATKVK
ncbi:polysaccharide deacetylase family protein [Mariniblastus fucicola]|nr:polysaccharide deacetylase family protein [Mariniblastus fucicola]